MSETLARQAAAGYRRLRADMAAAALFGRLAEDGLEALLLRGPVVARRLYREGERDYGDSDVLVPAGGREAVERVLAELGYRAYTAQGYARHWHDPVRGAEVDLHLTLWGVRAAPAALWSALSACRTTISLQGVPVPAPNEGATALVIALHACQHGALGLRALEDLRRAIAQLGDERWSEASSIAAATGSERALRQALSSLPEGRALLARLGLTPAMSVQAAMRMQGVRLPDYLFEGLTGRERLAILRRRLSPAPAELSRTFDTRAEASRAVLVRVHARRAARLPLRAAALARAWRSARREARRTSRGAVGT